MRLDFLKSCVDPLKNRVAKNLILHLLRFVCHEHCNICCAWGFLRFCLCCFGGSEVGRGRGVVLQSAEKSLVSTHFEAMGERGVGKGGACREGEGAVAL